MPMQNSHSVSQDLSSKYYLQENPWFYGDIITLSFGIFMSLFGVLSKYDLRSHGLYSLPNISFMQLLGHRLKISRSLVIINSEFR